MFISLPGLWGFTEPACLRKQCLILRPALGNALETAFGSGVAQEPWSVRHDLCKEPRPQERACPVSEGPSFSLDSLDPRLQAAWLTHHTAERSIGIDQKQNEEACVGLKKKPECLGSNWTVHQDRDLDLVALKMLRCLFYIAAQIFFSITGTTLEANLLQFIIILFTFSLNVLFWHKKILINDIVRKEAVFSE